MSDLLTVKHLNKSFDNKKILTDLSFSLKKGQITALMAPSGAGKTTLLRILMGLESSDSGQIRSKEPLQLSTVFQEDRLCDNLNPLSNIRLVTGNSVSKSDILDALSALGITESALRPVRELSGGERRRVALIRALLAPWNLLLLDEPFKGLDQESKTAAMEYVHTFCGNSRAVLLVTHDHFEAEYMADEILSF